MCTHLLRNQEDLDELVDILASAVGSLTNPLKLANTFKTVKKKTINDKTLKKYMDYLMDAFLVRKAELPANGRKPHHGEHHL